MKISSKQLTEVLIDNLDKKSTEEMKATVKSFVKFLADENLLMKWREIEQEINKIWKEKYGASNIQITSAHELSDEARSKLEKIAQGATLTQRIEDRLLGGAVIRIDDKRIDGSITGKLRRLKSVLGT